MKKKKAKKKIVKLKISKSIRGSLKGKIKLFTARERRVMWRERL